MSNLKITIRTKEEDFLINYLIFWKGVFGITETETEIIKRLCVEKKSLVDKGLKSEEISMILFLKKEEIRKEFGINSPSFCKHIRNLVKKEAIMIEGNSLTIHHYLNPVNEIIINFKKIEQ